MRKLADQAQSDVTRSAYIALEGSWLRLAQKSEEFSEIMPHDEDEAESRPI